MRCYLILKGQIPGVAFLTAGPEGKLIEQAHGHFEHRTSAEEPLDGFEVWDRPRHAYTWPEERSVPKAA